MEAWHGVAFPPPIPAMRETIEIVRSAAAGERLDYRGEVYSVPLDGAGRGIRSLARPTEGWTKGRFCSGLARRT